MRGVCGQEFTEETGRDPIWPSDCNRTTPPGPWQAVRYRTNAMDEIPSGISARKFPSRTCAARAGTPSSVLVPVSAPRP